MTDNRTEALEAALREALAIQKRTYGNSLALHLAMHRWADDTNHALAALTEPAPGMTKDDVLRIFKPLPPEEADALRAVLGTDDDDEPAPSAGLGERSCTCHPDDRPEGPCPQRYAASECQAAALRQSAPPSIDWFGPPRKPLTAPLDTSLRFPQRTTESEVERVARAMLSSTGDLSDFLDRVADFPERAFSDLARVAIAALFPKQDDTGGARG